MLMELITGSGLKEGCSILIFSYIFTYAFMFQMTLPFFTTSVYSWCMTKAQGL
jgi:hypothetical protein